MIYGDKFLNDKSIINEQLFSSLYKGRVEPKKLKRSSNKMLAGVCAGLAEYMNVDPTVVRVVYVALTIFSAGFPGLLLYLILLLLMPNDTNSEIRNQE